VVRSSGALAAGLAGLLAALATACASGPRPCAGLDACPGAQVCQVGRCAPLERLPADASSRRRVLQPVDIAYRDRASEHAAAVDDSGEIRAGSAAGGGSLLLLRFDLGAAPGGAIEAATVRSAFLVLPPSPDAAPSPATVELTVSSVLEPWTSQGGGPRALPRTAAPRAHALVSFAPAATARIDVTVMVRDALSKGNTHHGFAVRAPGGSDTGARFASAQAGGQGPTLDVYLSDALAR
jgi:hypothetical protein